MRQAGHRKKTAAGFHSDEAPRAVGFMETGRRRVVGERLRRRCLLGTEFRRGKISKGFVEPDGGDGYAAVATHPTLP